jgi:hypothetical protein
MRRATSSCSQGLMRRARRAASARPRRDLWWADGLRPWGDEYIGPDAGAGFAGPHAGSPSNRDHAARLPSRCAPSVAPGRPAPSARLHRALRAPRPRCRRCALPVPRALPLRRLRARSAAARRLLRGGELRLSLVRAGRALQVPGRARLGRQPGRADARRAGSRRNWPRPTSCCRCRWRASAGRTRLQPGAAAGARTGAGQDRAKLLLRVRNTGAQAALDKAARQANVQGAFGIEPLRHGELRGKAVLLVDDVMTSGASLHAAAQAVRRGRRGAGRGGRAGAHRPALTIDNAGCSTSSWSRPRSRPTPATSSGWRPTPAARCTSSNRWASRWTTSTCGAPAWTTTSTRSCAAMPDWDAFLRTEQPDPARMFALTTRGTRPVHDVASRPATGWCSGRRRAAWATSDCALRAGAAAEAADARGPAQPELVECGGRDGVRSVAAEPSPRSPSAPVPRPSRVNRTRCRPRPSSRRSHGPRCRPRRASL